MTGSRKQFTEKRIPVPWGQVAAKVYGPPMKKRILVTHGIMDNAGSLDRLIDLLPDDYQYVSLDLPGHGFSSHFPSGLPLQFFHYVHTIYLVLAALNWESCIYIGHSFGSHIGLYFSILYPGRIQKLICLDAIGPVIIPNKDLIGYLKLKYDLKSYAIESKRTYTKEEVINALQYKRFSVLNMKAAEAMFQRAVTKVGDGYKYNRDPRLKISVLPQLSFAQQSYLLLKLSVPTLVITADESHNVECIRRIAYLLYSYFKNPDRFNVICVPGNHDVHNNNPELVAPHICEFLRKNNVQSKL